jgi:hypothetical protein
MTTEGNGNEENLLSKDSSLQCLRIEINSHTSVFLYYKIYPKTDSIRFPQDRTIIVFFFDNEYVNEKLIKTYFSLVGEIDEIEMGNYINRKGSKKKRKVVNFAIVKFIDHDSVESILNRFETQMTINAYLEQVKQRKLNMNYDPLNLDLEEEGEEVDEEGFVTVRKDITKKRFNQGGMSFKVGKRKSSTDSTEIRKRKKKEKEEKGDFYWNFHILDKKREQYEELKNLFEKDKETLEKKQYKKQKI